MGTSSFGGTASNNARTDQHVSSGGIGFPVGRTAGNGKGPILITAVRGYASGLGAARSMHMILGPARTGTFSVAAGGSGASTGFRGVSNGLITNGGSGTFTMVFSGMSWFAHGGGGSTTDSYGTNLSGNLGGDFNYNEVPSAPTSPSVTGSGTSATVHWSPPATNGGAAVTGYEVQYATNSTFTAGLTKVQVGVVASVTINNLTTGVTYWFRVCAKNQVTIAAGTSSVASSAVSLGVAAGSWFSSGSHSFKATVNTVAAAPTYVSMNLKHQISMVGLDVTQKYSASMVFNFAPITPHPKPLRIQSQISFYDTSNNIIKTNIGPTFNITKGVGTFSWSNLVIPGGCSYILIFAILPALNSSGTQNLFVGDAVYLDAATFINGAPVAYFDGNSTGTWTGTTNNSTSQMVIAPTVAFYSALQDNNVIYTINVGEVTTTAVQTTNYATQLFNPSVTDSAVPALGNYAITDSNGIRVTAAAWNASGASVTPSIDTVTPGLINLKFIGPKFPIPGFAPPFSFSFFNTANELASLTILGAGVLTTPTVVNLLTGANPDTTPADVTSTFDSPFVGDIATLYDAGIWAAVAAAGPVLSIQFSVATNTLEGFGITIGSIVNYQNANWRISEVDIGYNTTSVTASWYTTMGDVDTAWSGQTLDAKDLVWTGYEFADQLIEPLKTA